MLDEKDMYLLINLVDLCSRTDDPEISAKLKVITIKLLDDLQSKTK